jgi:hypothetical protein
MLDRGAEPTACGSTPGAPIGIPVRPGEVQAV